MALHIHLGKGSVLLLIALLTSDIQIYVTRAWVCDLNFSSSQGKVNHFSTAGHGEL